MLASSTQYTDIEFVENFKKEHNEQFYVLIKMHLSFLLDMTTEESECFCEKVKLKRWHLGPFTRKIKSKHHQEGSNLNQDVLAHIHQLICFLKDDSCNLQTEGIFRRTGSLERQNELKTLLSQSGCLSLERFTVHDCASVLKLFLADLSEPLTTDIQYPIYCQIADPARLADINYESKTLKIIQLMLLLLPKENRELLQDIFELLHLVANNEGSNRMSAENLAKVFTPHLLCPRKLAPESLLKDSQMLFGTVTFMIKMYPRLFDIPGSIMLDFQSHHEKAGVLNESVKGAAHTVFTFVDNKLTAKENQENVTDAALAELYAHIQSMPESSKKRKLVKQFNKQNGHGTPLQVIKSSAPKSNKSFGDSLKKHMFHKKILKSAKRTAFLQMRNSSSEEMLDRSHLHHKPSSRGRLFCHNFDSSSEEEESLAKRLKRSRDSPDERPRRKSDSDISIEATSDFSAQYLTSTPACVINQTSEYVFTPENQGRKSMSPITRSAQRMSRAMQETMMTPRSRKPVLLVSGTNINNLAKLSPSLAHLQEEEDLPNASLGEVFTPAKPFVKSKSAEALGVEQISVPKMNKTDSPKTLSDTFKQYLTSRDMLTSESPRDSTFSSRSDDFLSCPSMEGVEEELSPCSGDKLTESMLYVLDGNEPSDESFDSDGEKKLVLKPRKFDENGKAIVFETSF